MTEANRVSANWQTVAHSPREDGRAAVFPLTSPNTKLPHTLKRVRMARTSCSAPSLNFCPVAEGGMVVVAFATNPRYRRLTPCLCMSWARCALSRGRSSSVTTSLSSAGTACILKKSEASLTALVEGSPSFVLGAGTLFSPFGSGRSTKASGLNASLKSPISMTVLASSALEEAVSCTSAIGSTAAFLPCSS